jgi:Synergist-CTERM protein sorting domain-containing protein
VEIIGQGAGPEPEPEPGPEVVPVTKITVTPKTAAINIGQQYRPTVMLAPSNATDKSIVWTSDNKYIVDLVKDYSTGRVYLVGVSAGTAQITFKPQGGKVSAPMTVTVRADSAPPGTVPVQGITVSPKTKTLEVGEFYRPKVTVSPTNATNKNVAWTTSNKNIVNLVSESGLVYLEATGEGTALITFESQGGEFSTSMTITVKPKAGSPKTVPATKITVSPASATVEVGQSYRPTVTVSPSNASNKNILWSVDKKDVVSVLQESGKLYVKGLKTGTAKVTFQAEGGANVSTSMNVTVKAKSGNVPVTSITVSPATKTLKMGESYKPTVTIAPSDATNRRLTWISSNAYIVSIAKDSSGELYLKALKTGKAKITFKAQGGTNVSASMSVTVVRSNSGSSAENSLANEDPEPAQPVVMELHADHHAGEIKKSGIIFFDEEPEAATILSEPDSADEDGSETRGVTSFAEEKGKEEDAGSGGCDAGFAGLVLLFAAPLFLRKKS